MELTNIGTIKKLFEQNGFSFSKSLGQNFITDPGVCPKMAELAGNMELVSQTRKIAEDILSRDPLLESKENRGLYMETLKLYEKDIVG